MVHARHVHFMIFLHGKKGEAYISLQKWVDDPQRKTTNLVTIATDFHQACLLGICVCVYVNQMLVRVMRTATKNGTC